MNQAINCRVVEGRFAFSSVAGLGPPSVAFSPTKCSMFPNCPTTVQAFLAPLYTLSSHPLSLAAAQEDDQPGVLLAGSWLMLFCRGCCILLAPLPAQWCCCLHSACWLPSVSISSLYGSNTMSTGFCAMFNVLYCSTAMQLPPTRPSSSCTAVRCKAPTPLPLLPCNRHSNALSSCLQAVLICILVQHLPQLRLKNACSLLSLPLAGAGLPLPRTSQCCTTK